MSARRDSRSPLFAGETARSDVLLARTLYKELQRSGRSRSQVLRFINTLLGVVASESRANLRAPPSLLLDPATGLPTRAAFHQLLLHELDKDTEHGGPAGALLLRVKNRKGLRHAAGELRRRLRDEDVVTMLGRDVIGVIVYLRNRQELEKLGARLGHAQEDAVGVCGVSVRMLEPGEPPRRVWTELWRGLRGQGRPRAE